MRTYIKPILLLVAVVFSSCQDPINVDVPVAAPRLVIEASIDWQKGTTGNNQTIKLSTSTPYFDTNIDNNVTGASVKIINNNSTAEFIFADQNNGTYTTSTFVPVINNSYTLEVIYNGEIYTATENFTSVSAINNVTQSIEGGFDDTLLEVNIFWNDPADEENYYFLKLQREGDVFPVIFNYPDEFVNGNVLEEFFENEGSGNDDDSPFLQGDVVDIFLYGISEQYNNYIQLLIEQYEAGGDPFAATPAEIKGNCTNLTTIDNYAFGYFRLSEYDTVNYTFQ